MDKLDSVCVWGGGWRGNRVGQIFEKKNILIDSNPGKKSFLCKNTKKKQKKQFLKIFFGLVKLDKVPS
jgi:hypothetical protein